MTVYFMHYKRMLVHMESNRAEREHKTAVCTYPKVLRFDVPKGTRKILLIKETAQPANKTFTECFILVL